MMYRRRTKTAQYAGDPRVIGTPLTTSSAAPPSYDVAADTPLQMGRPYVHDEGYYRCFDGRDDPRTKLDARRYVYASPEDVPDTSSTAHATPSSSATASAAAFVPDSVYTDVPSRAATHIVAPGFRAPRAKKQKWRPPRLRVTRASRRSAPSVTTHHHRAGGVRLGGQRVMRGSDFSWRDIPILRHESMLVFHNISRRYATVMGVVLACVIGVAFVGTAFAVKARITDAGHDAVASLKMAMASMSQQDFTASQEDLDNAYAAFDAASDQMGRMGRVVTFLSRFIPGASRIASGDHMVRAGAALTHAAKELHGVLPQVMESTVTIMAPDGVHVSFLALYQAIADRIDVAYTDVVTARAHMEKVRFEDIPSDYQDMFARMMDLVPQVETPLAQMHEARGVIEDVLGAHGPRTYLLLFQNNHEMRATGGFIGSYGIVKITDGAIEKIMVDDIYNPDGQLIDSIVPPLPIQKISANWSMHDSNWFPDFPVSARKVMDLYERTGGPTVDGVIALTPVVIQHMLATTGPIDLPAYNMQLTADNFMDVLQEEIEDRENYTSPDTTDANDADADDDVSTASADNAPADDATPAKDTTDDKSDDIAPQPKKILSDLMPILLDRILTLDDPEHIMHLADIVTQGLQERHILMYLSDRKGEEIILANGWGGAVEKTDTDYLSVINTNINGFKTDGVVDETVTHTATVATDGSIVDTVEITRVHNGGHTGRPWWDAVNADYMRLYVPEGSQLLSVEGQTRESMTPRLDYDTLAYERDEDIVREESGVQIDAQSGTRVYTDAGKTVFADWVYVSPQESVTVTYTYKLPFTITFDSDDGGAFGSYGLLVQKQAGSTKTAFAQKIILPEGHTTVWQSDANDDAGVTPAPLTRDRFIGTVFRLPGS